MAYRKIDQRIWNDDKFGHLSDDGKLLFFLILTHPNMTSLGAMRASPGGLAADLGWGIDRLLAANELVLSSGLVKADPDTPFICLPNFLKYNKPESPNVVKAWITANNLLPECETKEWYYGRLRDLLKAFSPGFLKAFREVMPGEPASDPPHAESKPRRKKSSASTPDFQHFTDFWCRSWAAVHKSKYPFAAKDGVAAAAIWKHIAGNSDTAQFLVRAYMDNTESFFAGHPLVKLNSHLPQFLDAATLRQNSFEQDARDDAQLTADILADQSATANRPADEGGGNILQPNPVDDML